MQPNDLKDKIGKLIAPHLPMIREHLHAAAGRVGDKAQSMIQNDAAMTVALRQVHGRLPRVVRLVVREERFVTFMLNNRDRIFTKD